jgi:alcohol dehydrogenase
MLFHKNEAIPEYYEFFNSVKIISGYKALENIPFELSRVGAKRPIIITDEGVKQAGLVKVVIDSFGGTDTVIGAVFDETPQDSSNLVVNRIASIYRAQKCDSIIAVGGGSVIDTAKGVNIVITEETDDLLKFMGNFRLNKPMKPFIVIPTTAGTGSEVTMAAVIANPEKNIKMQFTSDLILPKVAVLDPRMTVSMPPKITAATGMDALTHAVEAYVGPQKNPVSDAFAAAAIELIRNNLVNAVTDGSNKDVRLAMANASLLAGVAFSNSQTALIHGLAHANGGLCHVPHGIANSILLPFGLEFYIEKGPKTKSRVKTNIENLLLAFVGPEEFIKVPVAERGKATVVAIRKITEELNKLSGIPLRLREAGVPEDKLGQIAQATIDDGTAAFFPVEVSYEEALGVLKAAY